MSRVYISGKMTGLPNYNKEAFIVAEGHLRALGYPDIFNPAYNENVLGYDLPYQNYMEYNIKELLECTHIYYLKSWKDSVGARIERMIAQKLNMVEIFEK